MSAQDSFNQYLLRQIMKQIKHDPRKLELQDVPKCVVITTPQFFPRDVTDISVQCKTLAEGLVEKGVKTHVIAPDPWKAGETTQIGGFTVHYVGDPVRAHNPITWAMTIGMEIARIVSNIIEREGHVDLIHSHQWEMFPTGIGLQAALGVPLVVNFYSTEYSRNPYVENNYTSAVKRIEWNGSHLSKGIFVNGEWLREEVLKYYSPEPKKISVIDPTREKWTRDVLRGYEWVIEKSYYSER